MTSSVPSLADRQATYAATLIDEWIRWGLTDVVIGPGSRSTPLALAAASRSELRLHVRIDERSAAFFALGRALSRGHATLMLVTSGTAAAELHAAVAEADAAGVPLLVATADRPPELHGVGAPQTMDQHNLFGKKVRAFVEPGVPAEGDESLWRLLAATAWRSARGGTGRPGPVHLNLAFAEPLVGTPAPLHPAPGERPSDATERLPLDLDVRDQRVLFVVGPGVDAETVAAAQARHWVTLGDATARGTTPYFDALLRDDTTAHDLRPDLVIRAGGLPASKVLGERLRSWDVEVIGLSDYAFLADPDRIISRRLPGTPVGGGPSLEASDQYAANWLTRSAQVEDLLRNEVDHGSWSEIAVTRRVVQSATARGATLVVGSSMPVRNVEWWTPPRAGRVFANRGVNGIDGVTSTFLGVAADGDTIGLVGDVTFLHDVSALVEGVGPSGSPATLVVLDNNGGGIFSFLAQAELVESGAFEQLFGTPRDHDLVAVAAAFGHSAERVSTSHDLDRALDAAAQRSGLSVIVVDVPPRADHVAEHRRLHALVAEAGRR